jgi:hypothetical protein
MRSTAALATAIAALVLLVFALAPPAQGDVGFEGASRAAGAPGKRVALTIGCGFCFPPCTGEPGHRHPPADMHGACMLGDHGGPPASFAVWLTPVSHSLDRYTCDPGEDPPGKHPRGPCRSGSRAPHLPSFTYLGLAMPVRGPDEIADGSRHRVPRYRLIFGVPELSPGRYRYVLFCDACVEGPRGSLVADRGIAGPLRVLPATATASAGGGIGLLPWSGVAILAAALIVAGGLLIRRGKGEARPEQA